MRSQMSKIAMERFTSFGDLLKFLRRRSGLTQRELSIAVGYSHAQISRLELNQRQPDLVTVTARFIPALDLEDDPEVADRLLELAVEPPQEKEQVPGFPPYKGLQFFDESDSSLFFGREEITSSLVDTLRAYLPTDSPCRFLAVVGASGSGKSSIIRAGMIPALRPISPFSNWMIYSLTPTDRPLEKLASILTRESASVISTARLIDDLAHDQRTLHLTVSRITSKDEKETPYPPIPENLLLVVDQFEELFTLCRSETERAAFINNLMTAATEQGGATFVVLVLRADFYSQCAPYPTLRDALADQQEYIGAMTTQEMRQAIEKPARRGSWELEPGLVDLLLQEIGADGEHFPEPGALPLMSHALLETWNQRQGRKLTVSSYLATGGVRGAIANTADDIFQNEFDDTQQRVARNIFLRLTQFGDVEDAVDTRRRVPFEELIRHPEDEPIVREVLTRMANARLITMDNEVAEVAHEALIREWPTLREWLAEDREGLRLHRHLTLAANSWERRQRDPSELYRGARLTQAIAWAKTHTDALSALEETFLEASQELANREESEREARRQRELEAARTLVETQQQATTQLRKRAMYLTGAFILTLIMFSVAMYQGFRARQIAVAAEAERRIATSRELAAASLNNLNIDPERSILLALQSVSATRSEDGFVLPESLEALHRSIIASPVRMTLTNHQTRVLSVDFSPDGKQFTSIGDDGTVILWDALTGQEILRLPGETEPSDFVSTQRITYSPDGKLLVACDSNLIKIYDPTNGDIIQALTGLQSEATAVAFSRDGAYIAAGSLDGTVILWNTATGKVLSKSKHHTGALEGVTFSPDGKWLITASDDATIKVWNTATGDIVHSYSEFTGLVDSITFNPAGTQLMFGTADGLHIWQIDVDIDQDTPAFMDQEILLIPNSAGGKFSPDGSLLATPSGNASSRNAITLMDATTGRELLVLSGHTGWVMGLAFSPDGKWLASTSLDGTVKIWSLAPGNETIAVLGPRTSYGTRIAYNPNGMEFATNGGDGTATFWNAETGEPRLTLSGHDLKVLSVAFNSDGRRFATGSLDGSTIIWDTTNGEKLFTLASHEYGVRDIAFSSDGSLIVTGGFDGTAKVWDTKTGTLIHEIIDHAGLVLGVAFSPDGKQLATSSTDKTAKIWNIKNWELLFTLEGHQAGLPDITYSPDSSMLATGSGDGTAIIWDVETGAQLLTLAGHNSQIQSVAFSPDGKYLATGSEDNTTKVWDVITGKELLLLPGSFGGVTGVAFIPTDSDPHLIIASGDGTARAFLLSTNELFSLAQSRVTRSLTIEECTKYLHLPQCPMPSP
ncbi:MAG: helix-turn-helix domain-containing protein [Anaerolineales bacterium]|nr:helix-turn-helix domain-containing protein [Anaerolineales bacterium]